jgi:hypothetical protein
MGRGTRTLTIKYATGYAVLHGGDLIQESIQPTSDYTSVDWTNLYWDSDSTEMLNPAEAPPRGMFGFDFIRVYRRQLVVPAWVKSYTGFCNTNTIVSPILGMSFGPEELLYKPPTLIEGATFGGQQSWDVTVRLSYRGNAAGGAAIPWNKHWHASTFSWKNIYNQNGEIYKNIPTIYMGAFS